MRFLCRRLRVWMDDIPENNLDFGEPKCVQSACPFSGDLGGHPKKRYLSRMEPGVPTAFASTLLPASADSTKRTWVCLHLSVPRTHDLLEHIPASLLDISEHVPLFRNAACHRKWLPTLRWQRRRPRSRRVQSCMQDFDDSSAGIRSHDDDDFCDFGVTRARQLRKETNWTSAMIQCFLSGQIARQSSHVFRAARKHPSPPLMTPSAQLVPFPLPSLVSPAISFDRS